MKTITINVKREQVIPLGRQGENEATEVVFDCSPFVELYGPGTARLLHQRPGDPAPYIVPAVQDGDALIWTVTDADTAAPGCGKAELQWIVGNVLAKSATYPTRVISALDDGAETPPTGAEGWYQQMLAYIDRLKGDGVTDEQIAAAVDAYLEDNPVSAPVDSVNGKTGAVELTAADVGALAQTELQAGVDAALAQAKASGEFDGAPDVVSVDGAELSFALENNTEYLCADPVTSLEITGFLAGPEGKAELWCIVFAAGDSVTVSVPDTVVWAVAEPVFSAGSTYWISVVPMGGKYLAVWTEVEADGSTSV